MKKVTMVVLLMVCCFFEACSSKFDSNKWKNDKGVRQEQAADLIKSRLLLYKTPEEVVQLLGDFDYSNPIPFEDSLKTKFTLTYLLGGCDRSYIDLGLLTIHFEHGKSVDAYKDCE
jgi:hypothetical protein